MSHTPWTKEDAEKWAKEGASRDTHGSQWLCVCDCGNEKSVVGQSLTRGDTKSCGCLAVQKTKERQRKYGKFHSHSREYVIWLNMVNRCHDPNHRNYKDYGGRGIVVCDEWRESFERFASDIGQIKHPLTLDRIDVNGPYSKSNCRLASRRMQSYNRRMSNAHGFRGVKLVNGRYHSYIVRNKKKCYLGTFKTAKDAGEAYLKAFEEEEGRA